MLYRSSPNSMNFRNPFTLTGLLLALTMSLVSCDPKEAVVYPPEADLRISPTEGNTTTIFKFDTEGTSILGTVDTMLFFRFDWNADGEWDTHFSRSRYYEHRYWTKGNYTIIMEASSEGGLRDTLSATIEVVQGFSSPHPVIRISPETGHILTEFTLDASETTDDEDSLDQLQFRWDFDGDGFYDTPWDSEPVVLHQYSTASRYYPVVSVRDPGNLSQTAKGDIMVSMHNPNLVAGFSWTPEDGNAADIYVFDASASYDPDDPDNTFTYSWDFNNDGFYELEDLDSPTVEYTFGEEGDKEVKLLLKDRHGLINSTIRELFVAHANRPPTASFFAGADFGNTTTNFYFDATASSDQEDWEYQLEVRWDFDSDGNWDTEYSREKTASHRYGVAGEFTITLEVKDSGGLTSQSTTTVFATEGTNETGLAIDEETGDHYGTVKIGNQWWFAENLKNPNNKSCYRNNPVYCEVYGGMYAWSHAMAGSTTPGARGLCPPGWHIPTVDEWQELIDYVGGPEVARSMLEEGAPTDFNMTYAGQMSTSGSAYAGEIVNFWSSNPGAGDNAWTFSMQKDKDQVWKLSLGRAYRNSVRCIKN